jgi:hypothetical protein
VLSLRSDGPPGAPRRELLLPVGLTVTAAALLMLGPAPADAPAHLYRTLLVQHGAVIWDNLWYAGQYPLGSYSLLYYFPAALFGNIPLVLVAAVTSTVLFAAISFHEWGPLARWPTRVFGVLAAAPMFTGLYSYTLGFAALLAVLRAVQRRKTWLAIIGAVLTVGFSPLAFVFLCLILFAVLLTKQQITGQTIRLMVGLACVAGLEAAALALFPTAGVYPFNPVDFAAVIAVCSVGALLARRGDGGPLLTWLFVVWGLGSLLAYFVPSAVGDNVTRLRAFVFPLMLVAAAQARFRPRALTSFALAGALAYNLVPYLMLVPYRLDSRPERAAFWQPALTFLGQHRNPNYRVEVVPTSAHWESYWIPKAGYDLVRGWYRQLDVTTNPVLFTAHLNGNEYSSWLRQMSVRYVLLARTKLDPDGAPTEARLLRSGAAGVREVYRSANWTIYELPHPRPLLRGPAPAHLTAVGHQLVAGFASARGRYTLGIHYTPYWASNPAVQCIQPAPGGMTAIVLRRAGAFTLRITGGLEPLLDSLGNKTIRHC